MLTEKDHKKLEAIYQENSKTEPYFIGKNTKPYPKRKYEVLKDYVLSEQLPAEYLQQAEEAMKSSKKAECCCADKVYHSTDTIEGIVSSVPGTSCQVCSIPVPYSVLEETFISDTHCQKNRIGCASSSIYKNQELTLGKEIEETNSWGLDCFVSRNIQRFLGRLQYIRDEKQQEHFVTKLLLPVINCLPDQYAYDARMVSLLVLRVLHSKFSYSSDFIGIIETIDSLKDTIYKQISTKTNGFRRRKFQLDIIRILNNNLAEQNLNLTVKTLGKIFESLFLSAEKTETNHFRIHPKGVGIRCIKEEGIQCGVFVTKYLGELFPAWRWFEKQDAIKNAQKKIGFKPILPDFYNILLERHKQDKNGYNLIYVDPIVKGNFGSRLSHSCQPNCATIVLSVGGKYVIALYTIKSIKFGEELTFDYSSISEDKKEFQAAVCLCGNCRNCRGSFLHYSGSGSFAEILDKHHNLLERIAILYLAGRISYTAEHESLLAEFGLVGNLTEGLPDWMKTWCALILIFCKQEKDLLVKALQKRMWKGKYLYNAESALLESRGVLEKRVQDIAITISKMKHFFSLKVGKSKSSTIDVLPFSKLTDKEVADLLWNNNNSKAISGLLVFVHLRFGILPNEILKGTVSYSDGSFKVKKTALRNPLENISPNEVEAGWKIIDLIQKTRKQKKTLEEVKMILEQIANVFFYLEPVPGMRYDAAFDVLTWYRKTKIWFSATTYGGRTSPEVQIRNVDIGRDGGIAQDSIESGTKSKGISPLRVVYKESKKYNSAFVQGQLAIWYKQTVSSPWATLSAERRGTYSLPDLSSCFATPPPRSSKRRLKGSKHKNEYHFREQILNQISNKPYTMFSVNFFYKFSNKQKMYGSPWLDRAIKKIEKNEPIKDIDPSGLQDSTAECIQLAKKHLEYLNSREPLQETTAVKKTKVEKIKAVSKSRKKLSTEEITNGISAPSDMLT
eukprot:snap_masked-scaffold_4-processed-gene-20.15-mRNA-1 protein AED:0.44 eAED:0.45 QI:0/-1/0/1/-1/1/1/0/957